MISFEDILEMKYEAEKHGGEPHTIVCHPDNYDSIIKYAENLYGKPFARIKGFVVLGMPVVTFPSCPKDTIYVLSKDMVDQIRNTIREMLYG